MKAILDWFADAYSAFSEERLARKEAARLEKLRKLSQTLDRSSSQTPKGFGKHWLFALRERRLRRQQAKLMRDAEVGLFRNARVRQFSDLLKGIPAVVFCVTVAIVSVWGYTKQRDAGVSYWRRGEQALSAGDFRKSEIYLQKALCLRNTDRARISLTMARLFEQQGDLGRASVIMASLAPASNVGLPEAHLFVALRMAEQLGRGSAPDLETWKWHIDHAATTDAALIDKLKADYFLAAGDTDASFAAAAKAAEKEPSLWLNIAIGRQQQGNLKEAQEALLRARSAFESAYKREPEKIENVQRYVTALMLNNELAAARQVILEAQKSHPGDSLNPLLGQLYMLYADQSMKQAAVDKDPSRVGFAVRALLEAMRLVPNNPQTLARITAFCQGREEERQQFRSELLKVIADGTANEEAFFAMGVMEWTQGDLDGAIKYTRQALELAPKMTAAANNLAMFLAEQETPDLETALQVINEAIEKGPMLPDFIDTRAQILTKRGEYAEAITDYLRLLKLVENKAYVRGKLAELYALTGDEELASQMREAKN